MKNHIVFWIVGIAISLTACKTQTEKTYADVSKTRICELQENLSLIGDIASICFVDQNTFAIVSGGDATIQIYDMLGTQKKIVSKQGRGQFEYINPAIVRSFDDKIYVWCNMLLKFIVYDADGEPVAEYKYSSAVKDFIPYRDHIVIYNSGGISDKIIHVYDTKTQMIVSRLGDASNEHNLLTVNNSTAPFCISNDSLYYAPMDCLTIYAVSTRDWKNERMIATIPSNSFDVRKLETADLMNENRSEAFNYLQETSYLEALYKIDSAFLLKTMEGQFCTKGNQVENIDRHYVFYTICGNPQDVKSDNYLWQSFSRATLSTAFDDEIYFINNTPTDGHDKYELYRLDLCK